jgi:CubicO group peptidase (beta-lactamase class C family)
MPTRRALLLGGAVALVGARVLPACEPSGERSAATSSSSTLPMSSTSTSTTTPPPASAPPADAPTQGAWQGADFSSLDSFLERTAGEAFAIWESETMVHEWYRNDASYTRDIASAQKSILSLLIGRAIGDGSFALDTAVDDVLGPQWTAQGASAGITIEQLLAMSSGLDDGRNVIAAPGQRWRYSGAFAALFDVLTSVTGRSLNDVAQPWLFEPAGATSSVFYERPAGSAAPIGLRSTVPDLIALGRLVLDGGPPGLADGWLERSFRPSQAYNRSYGLLWWLNGQESFMLPGPDRQFPGSLVPTAPASMVAALGKDDQKLYVVPEHRLVVARLGGRGVPATQAARSTFDVDLWERLGSLRG